MQTAICNTHRQSSKQWPRTEQTAVRHFLFTACQPRCRVLPHAASLVQGVTPASNACPQLPSSHTAVILPAGCCQSSPLHTWAHWLGSRLRWWDHPCSTHLDQCSMPEGLQPPPNWTRNSTVVCMIGLARNAGQSMLCWSKMLRPHGLACRSSDLATSIQQFGQRW